MARCYKVCASTEKEPKAKTFQELKKLANGDRLEVPEEHLHLQVTGSQVEVVSDEA